MGLGNSTTRRPRVRLAALALLGALLLGAAPARAGGDFEHGFENELGRIAAREVVRFGKLVLLGQRPVYGARWAAAYPEPGYEAYGVHAPRRRPVRYPAPAHPSAAPALPAPAYAPSAPAPCEHSADPAPYQERIVWERYERVIQRPAPPPAYETYDPYDQQARY